MGFLASNFSTSTSWLVIVMIDLYSDRILEKILASHFSLYLMAWYDAGISTCMHSNKIHAKNSVKRGFKGV